LSVDSHGNLHTFSPELLGIHVPDVGATLGNVHSDTLDSVCASTAFKALHREIRAGVERCRATCDYFSFCGGGHPSNKWGELRSFDMAETTKCRFAIKAVFDEYLAAVEQMATRALAQLAAT
jgi:uncharacterized protein